MKNKVEMIRNVSAKAYEGLNPNSSGDTIANRIQTALTTSAKVGFDKQIAVIELIELMSPLKNKYDFIVKGSLEFGIGEQFLTMGYKNSVESSIDIDPWLPDGPLQSLDEYQSTSSGAIQRKVRNDYSLNQMREYVRDAKTFTGIIERQMSAGPKVKAREFREACRYLFGIVNDELPADYKAKLTKIKTLVNQNRIAIDSTTNYKSVVNYLNEFMDVYYDNISNVFNAGNKPNNPTGNIFLDGVDTGMPLLKNTNEKSETYLVMSSKFKNRLKQELGDTYNPEYWNDFTSQFGKVIVDTFADEGVMYILNKNALRYKSIFDEYTNTYYPNNSAFNTIKKWKDYWGVIPYQNIFSFKFTITARAKIDIISDKKNDKEKKK